MGIYYSNKFVRSYKKLSLEIKLLTECKEALFIKNVFNPSLGTHKLRGKFAGFWSFSVNKVYRIVFDFMRENVVRFYDIGTHDIYK